MSTLLAPFRNSVIAHEIHAWQLGVAWIRAVSDGDDAAEARHSEDFRRALAVLANRDDRPDIAIEIRDWVFPRLREARGRAPITCEVSIVGTPERRKSFVRSIAEAILNAACKGA